VAMTMALCLSATCCARLRLRLLGKNQYAAATAANLGRASDRGEASSASAGASPERLRHCETGVRCGMLHGYVRVVPLAEEDSSAVRVKTWRWGVLCA
jgi:hypothetical protein